MVTGLLLGCKTVHKAWASSWLTWSERRCRACVVRNVTGSNPSLPDTFYNYQISICRILVHSIILTFGSLHWPLGPV